MVKLAVEVTTPKHRACVNNPAGIWSDPLQYSFTFIPLPHLTSSG